MKSSIRIQLDSIFKSNAYEQVTYDKLSSAPEMVWVEMLSTDVVSTEQMQQAPGCYYKRIPSKKPGQLLFITRIHPDHGYHYHNHDCKETIHVLSGACKINDRKVLQTDMSETFYPQTNHKIHNTSSSVCEIFVEFTR